MRSLLLCHSPGIDVSLFTSNGRGEMCTGVTSIRLPPRPGTDPLDFSITRFNQVQLPLTALVASDINDLALPDDPLAAWWDEVWRIQVRVDCSFSAHPVCSESTFISFS